MNKNYYRSDFFDPVENPNYDPKISSYEKKCLVSTEQSQPITIKKNTFGPQSDLRYPNDQIIVESILALISRVEDHINLNSAQKHSYVLAGLRQEMGKESFDRYFPMIDLLIHSFIKLHKEDKLTLSMKKKHQNGLFGCCKD